MLGSIAPDFHLQLWRKLWKQGKLYLSGEGFHIGLHVVPAKQQFLSKQKQ
jgi:hypothetical protein